MISVIIASLGYAGGVLIDKITLDKDKYPLKSFIPLLFILLAGITLLLLPKWGNYNPELAFSQRYLLFFILMITSAIAWNIFYYQGIQKENLQELELIMILSPVVTIALAASFFPEERNWSIFIPGIIAALALVFSKLKGTHLRLTLVARRTMVAMFLFSLESIFIKELLSALSPAALYFLRTIIIAIIFMALYRPKKLAVDNKMFFLTLASAGLGVIQMVLKFYGFNSLGIVETTIILLLGPVLVYIASGFLLKEKFKSREIGAGIVIAVCVLYITIK